MTAILGLSFDYHDSAAALVVDGVIAAAAQEERFTRRKHDAGFPRHAIASVLDTAAVASADITSVVFYEKPFTKFGRLLDTYHRFAPRGLRSFLKAMPVWLKEKLHTRERIARELRAIGIDAPLSFSDHHLSHAASAFFPSPFSRAAILTIDGVGEEVTTSIALGEGNSIRLLKTISFPDSLGLFYSAVTYYCGFRVNSGEYKLMGLAPYGNAANAARLEELLRREVITVYADGSFRLNPDYFNYSVGLSMTRDRAWQRLTGIARRLPESEISPAHIDLALAAQHITEDIILKLAATARELTGADNLVLAGGVALNCTANGRLQRAEIFRNIWMQPAAGDAGGALGAALAQWHIAMGNPRVEPVGDAMQGAYLGPSFTRGQVVRQLGADAVYEELSDGELFATVAREIAAGKIVGWFQGRMEFGPRALGNRSILADPADPDMQRRLNLEIKYRESFRPFAPAVLEDDCLEFFDCRVPSRYMLLTVPVARTICRDTLPDDSAGYMNRLYQRRSSLPAVTHVDYTARVQTVTADGNPRFHALLSAFKALTGRGVLINTSFNVRGEPIVCTPADAYRCFMHTGMDVLVINNFVLYKEAQPASARKDSDVTARRAFTD